MMFCVRAAMAIASFSMVSVAAAQTGWTRIGRSEVAGDGGRATIPGRTEQGFRNELMICVEGRAIRILNGELRYRDDRTQRLRGLGIVRANACSSFFRLAGRNRDIASIDLTYDPASLEGGAAIVEIYAR